MGTSVRPEVPAGPGFDRAEIERRVRQRLGSAATPEQVAGVVDHVARAAGLTSAPVPAPATPVPPPQPPPQQPPGAPPALAGLRERPDAAQKTPGTPGVVDRALTGAGNFVVHAAIGAGETLVGLSNMILGGSGGAPIPTVSEDEAKRLRAAAPGWSQPAVETPTERAQQGLGLATLPSMGVAPFASMLLRPLPLVVREVGTAAASGGVFGAVRPLGPGESRAHAIGIDAGFASVFGLFTGAHRTLTARDVQQTAARVAAQQGSTSALDLIVPGNGAPSREAVKAALVGQEARAVPSNGVQGVTEVGTRPASHPSPAHPIIRQAKSADIPDPSVFGIQEMPLPLGPTPPLKTGLRKPLAVVQKENFLDDLGGVTGALYRETNVDGAMAYLDRATLQPSVSAADTYFASEPTLALGQGKNTGVLLELSPVGLKGQVNQAKPGWEFTYQNGAAEFVAKYNSQAAYAKAVRSVTVQPNAPGTPAMQRRLVGVLDRLRAEGWQETAGENGARIFTRPVGRQTTPLSDLLEHARRQPGSHLPASGDAVAGVPTGAPPGVVYNLADRPVSARPASDPTVLEAFEASRLGPPGTLVGPVRRTPSNIPEAVSGAPEVAPETLSGSGGRPPGGSPPSPPRGAPPPYRSPNPDIEQFFRETATPPSRSLELVERLRQKGRQAFIQFHEIAGDPFFADAREALRQGIDASRNARAEAVTLLQHVTQGLTRGELDIHRRLVVLRDLVNTTHRGLKVPRNLSTEAMQQEIVNLEGAVAGNARLQAAQARHVELVRSLQDDLVQRGVLDRGTVEANPHYFPHEVLDYLETKLGGDAGRGPSQGLRRLWRGYARQREGSVRDIYTDYLEVWYSHVSKVLRDNKVDDVIAKAAESYDVSARPMPGRADQARQVLDAYKQGTVAPTAGRTAPRMPKDLPDEVLDKLGYSRFFTASHRVQYKVRTVAEGAMTRILDAMANDPSLPASQVVHPALFREALATGAGKSVIIPKELAHTLETYRSQYAIDPSGFVASAIRGWKQLVLNVNPIRYNRRNFIGDMERTNAAMPSALKLVPRAVRDQIHDLTGKGSPETFTLPDGQVRSRYELAQERSVVASGRTATEVGRVREIEEFQRFLDNPAVHKLQHPLRAYSQAAQRMSGIREDWLRLATFYRNLDNVAAGKPLDYGVSDRAMVDALTDPVDKAAKIAREVLGDYSGLTATENGLRNGVMPFYAWLKINSTFWPQLVARQGLGAFARGGPIAGARASAWLASRVGLVYATVNTYNNLVHGDQEDGLPSNLRSRFHLNTGMKDNDGRWITLTDPTALDDFLQTVGLDGATPELRQLFQGQLTMQEYLGRRGSAIVRGPARAIVNRFGPELSLPLAAAGKTLYPDPFNPRDVPVGEEVSTVVQQAGIPTFVVDAARAVFAGRPQDAHAALFGDLVGTAGSVSPILGATATAPVQDPALVQEAAQRTRQLQQYMEDVYRREAMTVMGLSRPNLTPQDRAAEVRRLDDLLRGKQDELVEAVRKEVVARRRASEARERARRPTAEAAPPPAPSGIGALLPYLQR